MPRENHCNFEMCVVLIKPRKMKILSYDYIVPFHALPYKVQPRVVWKISVVERPDFKPRGLDSRQLGL